MTRLGSLYTHTHVYTYTHSHTRGHTLSTFGWGSFDTDTTEEVLLTLDVRDLSHNGRIHPPDTSALFYFPSCENLLVDPDL